MGVHTWNSSFMRGRSARNRALADFSPRVEFCGYTYVDSIVTDRQVAASIGE